MSIQYILMALFNLWLIWVLKKDRDRIRKKFNIAYDALRDIDMYSDVADPPLKAKDLANIATRALDKIPYDERDVTQL